MGLKIGFIGLGQMGLPMAANLLKAGYDVLGNDLREPDLSNISSKERFQFVSSPLEVAKAVNVLILMLPDSKIVDDTLWNKGVAQALTKNSIVIDMSSSHPVNSRDNEAKLKELGLKFVDAPVSGGVKKAIDGSLSIIIGGEISVYEEIKPLLEVMGKTLVHVGPAGAGHAIKALNNYVSAAGLIAASEALVAANKFGINPHVVTQVLNASTGKNNSTENKVEQYMLNGAFNSGFSLALMRKDVETALSFMNLVGKEAQFAKECVNVCRAAEKALPEKVDHTAVYKYVENQ